MAYKTIKLRGDTATNWRTKNPILANREIVWEKSTSGKIRFKIGDGVTPYNDLAYNTDDSYSNKNYLHNWDFRNPVLRGGDNDVGPWTITRKYTIARWLMYGSGTVSLTPQGIMLTPINNGSVYLEQSIENMQGFLGRMVSAGVNVVSGEARFGIVLANDNYSISGPEAEILTSRKGGPGIINVFTMLPASSGKTYLKQYIAADSSSGPVVIETAKFEIGSKCTIEYDSMVDANEEFIASARYSQFFSVNQRARMVSYGTKYMDFLLPGFVPMRILPTIESGEFDIRNLSGSTVGLKTTPSFISKTPNLILRLSTEEAHGLTDGIVVAKSGGVLVSADL